jgi:hypothetical protein
MCVLLTYCILIFRQFFKNVGTSEKKNTEDYVVRIILKSSTVSKELHFKRLKTFEKHTIQIILEITHTV